MNLAARLENSSIPNHIQISSQTADELRKFGKDHWIEARSDIVHIKGKGELQTYFAKPPSRVNASCAETESVVSSDSHSQDEVFEDGDILEAMSHLNLSSASRRLVDWNVEVLYELLENIVQTRASRKQQFRQPKSSFLRHAEIELAANRTGQVVDEMTQILSMPSFDPKTVSRNNGQAAEVVIPPCVKEQLKEFILVVANLYLDVPFHNFDHASHVRVTTLSK